MSARGPAANTLSGTSHAYLGVGNGPFQQYNTGMPATLLNPIQNWGESVVDFRLAGTTVDSSPSQYFTPWNGASVGPNLGTGSGGHLVSYTFEALNQNDFDMATSGLLLFDDLGSAHRLLTMDKAGYGYLLTQGSLCGSSSCYPLVSGASGGQPGGAAGDPGDAFPFGASTNLCPDTTDPHLCDWVASLAFNKDDSPKRLYFWPNGEALTSFQLSDNSPQPSSGTLATVTGSLTSVALSAANQVITGDQITNIAGQPTQTVTAVNADSTAVTVSPGFGSAQAGVTGWKYNGYFINPAHDSRPIGSNVEYPGGGLVVTSNGGSGSVVWGLATVQISTGVYVGTMFAYDADTLSLLWCTNSLSYCDGSSAFSVPTFGLPTILNGNVYVPTYGVTISGSTVSGLIVYLHTP